MPEPGRQALPGGAAAPSAGAILPCSCLVVREVWAAGCGQGGSQGISVSLPWPWGWAKAHMALTVLGSLCCPGLWPRALRAEA